MRFSECGLPGAFVIDPEPFVDERGLFARTFCAQEFAAHGLPERFVQCSVSLTRVRGTVRGMHYQTAPALEAKLVRCTAGAVHDVIVDLRPGSPTWGRHAAVHLTAANRRAIYVPPLFAHGFQSLEPDSEVFYQMSEYFTPECATGVRHDDPTLGIRWPMAVTSLAEKDRQWPLLAGRPSSMIP